MSTNPDLPTEQVEGKPQAVADALMDLICEFYPPGHVNGAQIFEMLDALAIVTGNVIGQTGEHRPDFDSHFLSQLARQNIINLGLDPDEEEDPGWEENSIECPNCEHEAKKHQRQLVRKNHIVMLNWYACESCNWAREMSEQVHDLRP